MRRRELFVVVVQTKPRAVCCAWTAEKTIRIRPSDVDRLTDESRLRSDDRRPVRYDGGGIDDGRCRRVAFRSVVHSGCTVVIIL